MSIDMYLDHSDEQAASTAAMADAQLAAYEETMKNVTDFINNSGEELKGAAYDSFRTYLSEMVLPLVKGGILISEFAKETVSRFPQAYREQVGEDSLKEDDLREKIATVEELIREARDNMEAINAAKIDVGGFRMVETYQGMIDNYEVARRALQEKLDKLLAFNASSPEIFSGMEELRSLMKTGSEQAKGAWNASTGTYVLPEDLSWATNLSDRYAVKDLSSSDQAYVKNLQEQYGFDAETAKQILEVKKGIDKKFPKKSKEDRDQLLLLILGGFVYLEAGNTEGLTGHLSDTAWENTVSTFNDLTGGAVSTPEEMLAYIGYDDEKKIARLRYQIRLQNQISSGNHGTYDELEDQKRKDFYITAKQIYGDDLTEEEFEKKWNTFYKHYSDKADFAHHAITTATILDGRLLRGANLITGSHELTNDLAGWLGDAVLKENKGQTSFGSEDYKADLDAVNITIIMREEKLSYLEASRQYYAHLETDYNPYTSQYTRAELFLRYKSLSEVKEKIFFRTIPMYRRGSVPDEQTCMDYLKEHQPDTYNFIRSLEDKKGELEQY